MPRRSPFTLLCQTAARLAAPSRVDLHTHTTASDGDFTPSQLIVQARAAGLNAIAITDHDTTAGLAEAKAFVDNPGKAVKQGLDKAEADKLMKLLQENGATVELA